MFSERYFLINGCKSFLHFYYDISKTVGHIEAFIYFDFHDGIKTAVCLLTSEL